MNTRVLSTNEPGWVEAASAVLAVGGLVAFPTDTVYGLAALPFSAAAVERLFEAKGRDASKAIAVLLGDLEQADRVSPGLGPAGLRLAAHFWPGALTLVVPRSEHLPETISPYPTIGLRIPDHPAALQLLRACGPLATTSANRSGQSNTFTAQDVQAQLGGRIELIIDGGAVPGGTASTVVDCSGADIKVLRRGPVGEEALRAVLGESGSSSIS